MHLSYVPIGVISNWNAKTEEVPDHQPSYQGSPSCQGMSVTVLTPFLFSPMTDNSVGCLPELFLAYCTITDTSSPDSCPDSWAIPDTMADDPVPLLSLHSSY